ncbi:MAG: Hsp20/alpha crystallin family protein [Gammaproteobacteria bacterium]|nr:Hsp20/alpha crystallin family protein [Gammaproteobacteria bacterium]
MNLVNWSPFREFDDLFSRFPTLASENLARSAWLPPVDISETEDAYQIEIEIPAVAGDDVSVSVKDGVLSVTGERKFEKEIEGKRHRVERRFGKFTRSFRLPENVDEESISATSEAGLLRLVISKREVEGPRMIEVKVH